jgi:hypothetical protein
MDTGSFKGSDTGKSNYFQHDTSHSFTHVLISQVYDLETCVRYICSSSETNETRSQIRLFVQNFPIRVRTNAEHH